jgi:hypothetical protein
MSPTDVMNRGHFLHNYNEESSPSAVEAQSQEEDLLEHGGNLNADFTLGSSVVFFRNQQVSIQPIYICHK